MYEFNSDLGMVLSGGLRPPAECTNWVKNSLFFVVLTRYKTTTHAVFDESAKATRTESLSGSALPGFLRKRSFPNLDVKYKNLRKSFLVGWDTGAVVSVAVSWRAKRAT